MGLVTVWRSIGRFFDRAWVEWGMFILGVILIIIGIIITPLPGPGGVFFIVPGAALILKTSMWARRRYVRFKRWQPKAGHWTDLALRRPTARRREARRKERKSEDGSPQLRHGD